MKDSTKKTYTLEEKRKEYGNAYLPWEKKADEYLMKARITFPLKKKLFPHPAGVKIS